LGHTTDQSPKDSGHSDVEEEQNNSGETLTKGVVEFLLAALQQSEVKERELAKQQAQEFLQTLEISAGKYDRYGIER